MVGEEAFLRRYGGGGGGETELPPPLPPARLLRRNEGDSDDLEEHKLFPPFFFAYVLGVGIIEGDSDRLMEEWQLLPFKESNDPRLCGGESLLLGLL